LGTCQNLTFERKKTSKRQAFENLRKLEISGAKTEKEQRKNVQKMSAFEREK
jgi:hypothetical protein